MGVKVIEKIQLTIGVVCLSIFFIAILIQVFARYFGIPVIWTEEVANYSFIWAVFMGASIMVNHRQHFRFEGLSKKLKGKPKIILDIIIDGILLIFNVLILYYGCIVTMKFWNYNWVSLPSFKMGYVWLCIPIMGATMSIYVISHIKDHISKFKRGEIN